MRHSRMRGGLAGFLTILAVSLGAGLAYSAPVSVDLQLVLAVDVSGSVDEAEGRLQRMGYVNAFRSPAVLRAIQSGRHKSIAVTYMEWAGFDFQRVVVGWRKIHDGASAEAFAYLLSQAPIGVGPYTSISGAIDFALPLFENNGFTSERRAIDISGDGPNNSGEYVTNARDRAITGRRDDKRASHREQPAESLGQNADAEPGFVLQEMRHRGQALFPGGRE